MSYVILRFVLYTCYIYNRALNLKETLNYFNKKKKNSLNISDTLHFFNDYKYDLSRTHYNECNYEKNNKLGLIYAILYSPRLKGF